MCLKNHETIQDLSQTTYILHEKNPTYIFHACTKNIRMSDTPLPNHNAHKIKKNKRKTKRYLNIQKHNTGTTMTHKRIQPQAIVAV